MIRTVIIDDEKNAIEVLELQLKQFCKNIEIVGNANSGLKGIEIIKKHKPELVFLDIEMPIKNGFDVLNETRDHNYKVIFTTAYDQFAIKAFKYSAIDYLLKPIDINELQAAVQKLSQTESNYSLEQKISLLFTQYNLPQKDLISLPIGDSIQVFRPKDIIRCESESNYTHIYLVNGKHVMVSKTLKEIEETLSGLQFFRIHQSHLVNLNHIDHYNKSEGSYVVLSDGKNLAISRNKKEEFMDQFRKL